MKTLDLVLKHKWYDMIACGEKREEYRELTEYWIKRLLNLTKDGQKKNHYFGFIDEDDILGFKNFDAVRFHRGYTSTTMTFEIESITIGEGREEWGAEPGKDYFVIKLGNRINETD